MSRTIASGRAPSRRTPFQCFLFMCHAPVISGCAARSCSARAGSHFRLTEKSAAARAERANILASWRAPPATAARTLKTDVSGPNGKSSKAPGKPRQIPRSAAASMLRAYWPGRTLCRRPCRRAPGRTGTAPAPAPAAPAQRKFSQRPKRLASCAGQAFMMTSSPAAFARAAAASSMTPSCIQTAFAPTAIA